MFFNVDENNLKERLIAGYICVFNLTNLQHFSFQETYKNKKLASTASLLTKRIAAQ